MDQLEPCPVCQRHVRISETRCPFCSADVADAMGSAPTWVAPNRRLSRAALLALGMGAGVVAGSTQGCSEDEPASAEEAGEDLALEQGVSMPLYGLSPRPDQPPVKPLDAGANPPAADAGAGDPGAADAGRSVTPPRRRPNPPSEGGGTIRPLYGAPIVRSQDD